MGLISLNVLDNLQFHLDGLNSPWEMWAKFKDSFGTINEFKPHQIKEKLSSLVLDSFPSIEDFLMRFKQQILLLQGFEKVKIVKECIYLILSKVWGNFQIFSSIFLSTMDALGSRFIMPTFDVFYDHLTRKQAKLSQLDSLTKPKY